jgi:hypothetical protein
MPVKSRIGEMLVQNGIINEDQLNKALAEQKGKNKKLGEILIELGFIKPKDLIWMLSEQAAIPFVDLRPEMLDSVLINSFPEKLLYDNCIIPLYATDDAVYVALGDPLNAGLINSIAEHARKQIVIAGAEPKQILGLLDKFFLSQQSEAIINGGFKGKISVRITDSKATVEFTSEDGVTATRQIPVEVKITIGKIKGGMDDARD